MEDIFKDVPEDVIERIKQHYETYKITVEEPVLTFEDFSLKIYELGLLYNEIKEKEKEILDIKKELGSISEEDYELLSM